MIQQSQLNTLKNVCEIRAKLSDEILPYASKVARDIAEATAKRIENIEKGSYSRYGLPGVWARWAGRFDPYINRNGSISVDCIELGCRGNADEHVHTINLTNEMLTTGQYVAIAMKQLEAELAEYLEERKELDRKAKQDRVERAKAELAKAEADLA